MKGLYVLLMLVLSIGLGAVSLFDGEAITNASTPLGKLAEEIFTKIEVNDTIEAYTYSKATIEAMVDEKMPKVTGAVENNIATYDASGQVKDSGTGIGAIPDASKTYVEITVGTTGADYTNLNTAIDYVVSKGGGVIKLLDMITYAAGTKDVSDITFVAGNSDSGAPGMIFWNSGAGAWTGNNVTFDGFIIRARPGSSGSLLTMNGTTGGWLRLLNCTLMIDGSTSPSLATSLFNLNAGPCQVVMHNSTCTRAAPGNRSIFSGDSAATIFMTGKSVYTGATPLVVNRDAGSSILYGTAGTDTLIDDASRVLYSGTVTGTDVKAAIDQLDLEKLGTSETAANSSLLESQAGSYYLDRANHTGTQNVSTLDNFTTEVQLASPPTATEFTDYYYVDPVNGSDVAGDGSFGNKWATINHATTTIGQPVDAADYQRSIIIDIGSGNTYTENIWVGHRAITIFGRGCVITGNITREIADEYEYGVGSSTFRGCLTLLGGYGNGQDTHNTRRQGLILNGNYYCQVESGKTGSTTHDTCFKNVRLNGTLSEVSTAGTSVLYVEDCIVLNDINYTGFYGQRWINSAFDCSSSASPILTVGTIVNVDNCSFGSTTLALTCSAFGSAVIKDSKFTGVTLTTGTVAPKFDAVSYTSFLENVTVSAGTVNAALIDDAKAVKYSGTVTGSTVKTAIDQLKAEKLGTSETAADSSLLNSQLPSYYLDRANHTGTQNVSTLDNFTTEVQLASPAGNSYYQTTEIWTTDGDDEYTLTHTPSGDVNVIYEKAVWQVKNTDYTVSAEVITFTPAIEAGHTVMFSYIYY